jgi:hypothetical protein
VAPFKAFSVCVVKENVVDLHRVTLADHDNLNGTKAILDIVACTTLRMGWMGSSSTLQSHLPHSMKKHHDDGRKILLHKAIQTL